MERIVIEVDETTGKKWRLSSQKQRERIAQKINIRLAKELSDSKEEFKQYLDELSATMKERGLTENILQEILKDDE
jgi:phosphotransacetylase